MNTDNWIWLTRLEVCPIDIDRGHLTRVVTKNKFVTRTGDHAYDRKVAFAKFEKWLSEQPSQTYGGDCRFAMEIEDNNRASDMEIYDVLVLLRSGSDSLPDSLEVFWFRDRDLAMLFKLTFAG